jgi:hypothetical protein
MSTLIVTSGGARVGLNPPEKFSKASSVRNGLSPLQRRLPASPLVVTPEAKI